MLGHIGVCSLVMYVVYSTATMMCMCMALLIYIYMRMQKQRTKREEEKKVGAVKREGEIPYVYI